MDVFAMFGGVVLTLFVTMVWDRRNWKNDLIKNDFEKTIQNQRQFIDVISEFLPSHSIFLYICIESIDAKVKGRINLIGPNFETIATQIIPQYKMYITKTNAYSARLCIEFGEEINESFITGVTEEIENLYKNIIRLVANSDLDRLTTSEVAKLREKLDTISSSSIPDMIERMLEAERQKTQKYYVFLNSIVGKNMLFFSWQKIVSVTRKMWKGE